MGHLAGGGVYGKLRERLDRMPVGAPDHPALREILQILFEPAEAELAVRMPFRFARIGEIARRAGKAEAEVLPLLESMARKGLVLDLAREGGEACYVPCPTVVGFFEFSMMRVQETVDQRKLAGLYEEYMFHDPGEAFLRDVAGGRYSPFRTLVHEPTLPEAGAAEVLDYERASHAIREAKDVSVGLCHCRHVAEHLGRACEHPQEICMSLGSGARWVQRRGFGRAIPTSEALDILDRAREGGLVQIADNVQERVGYICHCCGCCCGVLRGYSRLEPSPGATITSNYIAKVAAAACVGCGKCVEACPVGALNMAESPEPGDRKPKVRLEERICLGCGVCVAACPTDALSMEPRSHRVHTPEDMVQRIFLMALERGKLHHVLFDGVERLDLRALKVLVGLFLRTPGVRRALLAAPVRSWYLQRLAVEMRKKPDMNALD